MKHLAIIADGNRRWEVKNNFPSGVGHAQGLTTIENICEWAIQRKVLYLTVFCFSTENWSREKYEIDHIMSLAREYFINAKDWYVARGIKVQFSGRRDRLPKDIVESMGTLESATINGKNLTLIICVDYGGRDEIARAIELGAKTVEDINNILCKEIPEPDMILRTGGQQRLSNFLLWQSAYAELMFSNTLFPDLEWDELDGMLLKYNNIQRNFGK